MKKLWVHIRFVIKFIPIQLLGIVLNIYGAVLALISYFIFGYSDFIFYWAIISILLLPLAIVLENWLYKWNPLWFMLDDGRFSSTTTTLLTEDYENWLGNRSINFITDWLWHIRNRIWNLLSLFNKEDGDEYINELIINTLKLRGKSIELFDDNGFMEYDNFAGLKWITKSGIESFQTHSGVKISYKYSIFGKMKLYYIIGKYMYYKYSTCFKLFKIFNRDIWFTFKYHPNNETGTIHMKIQWEKM